MKLIEVFNLSTNTLIAFNPKYIIKIVPYNETETRLHLINNHMIRAKASYLDICKLIIE